MCGGQNAIWMKTRWNKFDPRAYYFHSGGMRLYNLIRDLKHKLRHLVRTPVFTLAMLITLALGLGISANTAIFSVINSVLLKSLPIPEPDRLVGVWQTAAGVT